jgi:uncharacterized protein (TIGR03435 family)
MKRWTISLVLAAAAPAFAGQASERLEFEVASIKPSTPSPDGQIRSRMSGDSAGVHYQNVTLRDCIRVAYGVKDTQIAAPEWMGSSRFDIEAKVPAGLSSKQIPEMVRTMLEDRFRMKTHRETREQAVYALAAAKKGATLKALEEGAKGGYSVQVLEDGIHVSGAGTMGTLADVLSRFSDRAVTDRTGLGGMYEFKLTFAGRIQQDAPGGMRDALEQVGLTLEPRKAPVEMVVVDSAEKAPTEN